MSLTFASPPSALVSVPALEHAILAALAYSDIFDHPLTLDELHRFLVVPAAKDEVAACVSEMTGVLFEDGYYFLADRPEIVELRRTREANSRKAFRRAVLYGRILGGLPFIRMVAMTGSLAMLNLSKNRDMDFMLIAKPGRVWLARAFALAFGRLARLVGDVICPNVIVSENALVWDARSLYAAREFAQMIPVSGLAAYHRLLAANPWVNEILPNAPLKSTGLPVKKRNRIQSILEFFLPDPLAARFEQWEMTRKISRLKAQKGYGLETNFSADVCQGNFDHHGAWAMKMYDERLRTLSLWDRVPEGWRAG